MAVTVRSASSALEEDLMSLLTDAMTDCVYMNETTLPDGRGGGINTWVPGAAFKAGFELQNSLNEAVAQAQGVKGI